MTVPQPQPDNWSQTYRISFRYSMILVMVVYACLSSWSSAQPRFASPDEPEQAAEQTPPQIESAPVPETDAIEPNPDSGAPLELIPNASPQSDETDSSVPPVPTFDTLPSEPAPAPETSPEEPPYVPNEPVTPARPLIPPAVPVIPDAKTPSSVKPMPLLEQAPEPAPEPPPKSAVEPTVEPAPKPQVPSEPKFELPKTSEPPPSAAVQAEPASPQWNMFITPGISSNVAVPSTPMMASFELDAKTLEPVGPPEYHQIALSDVDIEINSQQTQEHNSHAAMNSPRANSPAELASQYQQIYNTIPYSRAEYLANPGYRHEATLEMLFGQMRPTTIHKQDTPRRIYNLPPIHEGPRPPAYRPAAPLSWYSPLYGVPRYGLSAFPYGWTPNSTFRRYPTTYGPLFNRYYRPLVRPWGY